MLIISDLCLKKDLGTISEKISKTRLKEMLPIHTPQESPIFLKELLSRTAAVTTAILVPVRVVPSNLSGFLSRKSAALAVTGK